MNKKVLIIFKYPRGNWNPAIISKFSNFYETDYLYLSDFKDKNFENVISEINKVIDKKKIDITVFDVDYFKFTNFFFIEKIICKKKILITGDDFDLHEMNSITASACDLVLSACPLSVLKYKEKGYESYFISFEPGKINENSNSKDIDVLFFGALSEDRKEILKYISEQGISLKNVGHEEGDFGLDEKELFKLISKSKIVLNLSKSRSKSVKSFTSESIFNYNYHFKGRIIMAGLNGAACVSEYSPGQELFFNNQQLPSFYTKEECVTILKKMLSDEQILSKYTNQFVSRSKELYEDKKNFHPIFDAIENSNHKKITLRQIPYWYLRIAAKHIILRNISLINLHKTIFQLRHVFMIIRKTKLIFKFLILFESIINILWYSFVYTVKSKK